MSKLVETRTAVLGYCNAANAVDQTDASDFNASMREIKRASRQYGVVLDDLDGYVALLRRYPDAEPPPGNALLHDTPRHDAEDFLSDELTCDASAAQGAMRAWRTRIRTVLAGLPPSPSV